MLVESYPNFRIWHIDEEFVPLHELVAPDFLPKVPHLESCQSNDVQWGSVSVTRIGGDHVINNASHPCPKGFEIGWY
jgi:hypothetical protein